MTHHASPAPRGLPDKVLIANRGEIAVRIARTCRTMGIGTVAVYSDIDAGALHVEVTDEAVRLGGATPAESYLRGEALIAAAQRTGAAAIHPGYGFLSEAPAFARLVHDAGLLWIGPPVAAIEAMGDKLSAKRLMAEAGVPLVTGMELDADLAAADLDLGVVAEQIGFPVMVKAAAGGGGKGMRVVRDPSELHEAIAAARREAGGAFGDDRVFLERFVTRPRHLEVQVFGDSHGRVVHLFERECSVQRRHQKVVEETPSPGIEARVRSALGEAAVDAARAIGYVNAGTVEFIGDEAVLARLRAGEDLDPRSAFAFLEVNTRLQVEHPVTEEVVHSRNASSGGLETLDLVRLQLLVAAGEPLPFAQDELVQRGHAIEVRLYAEDPAAGYLPATGTLHAFAPAGLPGVRWDSGIRQGDEIPTHYDPMLAKVIATAKTRPEAALLLARELDRSALLGAITNRDLLVGILRDEVFLAGETTTAFLDERFPGGLVPNMQPDEPAVQIALIAAALAAAIERRERAPVLGSVRPGFANAGTFVPTGVYELGEQAYSVRYAAQRDGTWQVVVSPGDAPEDQGPHPEATAHVVLVHGRAVLAGEQTDHSGPGVDPTIEGLPAAGVVLDLEVDGHRQRVHVARHPATVRSGAGGGAGVHVRTPSGRVALVERPRFPGAAGEEVAGATLAPMPGAVVQVAAEVGEAVSRGALLVSVEAMKMEHRITAPFDGVVSEVRVVPGQQVDADEVLVVVDAGERVPDDDEPGSASDG